MRFSEQPKIVFNETKPTIYGNHHESPYFNLLSFLFNPAFVSAWVQTILFRNLS